MEGNQTMLDPPEVRSLSLSHLLSAGPWSPGQACADACSCAQAANVTSGRITEKEVKSFAFDKSYWCVRSRPSSLSLPRPTDQQGGRSDVVLRVAS